MAMFRYIDEMNECMTAVAMVSGRRTYPSARALAHDLHVHKGSEVCHAHHAPVQSHPRPELVQERRVALGPIVEVRSGGAVNRLCSKQSTQDGRAAQ